MSQLHTIRCVACEGGVPPLSETEVNQFLQEVRGWSVSSDAKWIYHVFKFKDHYETMAFVNAIAWISHQENHHPDLEVGYNHCKVSYQTHAIGGLSKNDFICAAKIDQLT
ncbi:MAG TPA: 4a-hydroxytetrahydrobiopterin dehydratase [Gammaproteobacteria bacterium]|jgi:4a-hydroxytetrahydrobiopterin dehydratase|nr:4a-hydroxytetrahydrobiopterin dehydratase [Gammaproteobacteria bacterium]